MKFNYSSLRDIGQVILIFLMILGCVKLFGWMFKNLFN